MNGVSSQAQTAALELLLKVSTQESQTALKSVAVEAQIQAMEAEVQATLEDHLGSVFDASY